MSEKLTNILGYLTLFAILAAIWVLFGEDPSREQGARGEKLFPELETSIETVTSLTFFSSGGGSVTLKKEAGRWRTQERDGYSADAAKVRAALRGLFLSTRREPKTDNAERMERLGLGGKAVSVTLRDVTDKVIASLEIGKRKEGGSGRSLTYVFKEGDSRSWLVSDIAEVSSDPAWWILKKVYEIDGDRAAVLDFGAYALERPEIGADLTLTGLKAGESAAPGYKLSEVLGILTDISAEDVMKMTNPLSEPVVRIKLMTLDGLSIDYAVYLIGGAHWMQVLPSFDTEAINQAKPGELPGAPFDGALEAENLMINTEGWLFKIKLSDAEVLMRERGDYVESISEETEVLP